jgi:DNA-binding transcriptional ArsR family regulator
MAAACYYLNMLESLFDNRIKEIILLSSYVRKDVYARDIASLFGLHLLSVQNQFKKLENGGILVSKTRGRTKLYSLNPRNPFFREITALLDKVLYFLPDKEKKKYYTPRLRPRRTGKPL